MQLRCPSCQSSVDVDDTFLDASVSCETCGTIIDLVNSDETTDYVEQPGVRISRFELMEQVGRGAFGTVWRARDTELDRDVAIKIPRRGSLTSTEVDSFFREAQAAAQLNHPNIVRVHEVGREDETVFYVSDYVQGMTLSEWLTGKQPTPREAVEIVAKVADALHHAHECRIIHRDVKPSNIMLDEKSEPYIMDFGLAKREADNDSMTVAGFVMGTPSYISPEQARGDASQADRRTDIYSLGVVLFELLTGEKPFRGSRRMLLHQAIFDEAPPPRRLVNSIPRDLDTICLKCLEKTLSQRYSTAKEVEEELQRFLRGEPIVARPIGRLQRGWRWCQRNVAVACLLTGLMVTLLAGLIGVSTQWWRADHHARRADKAASAAEIAAGKEREAHRTTGRYLYVARMNMIQRAYESGNPLRAIELLQLYRPGSSGKLGDDLRAFEWHYWWRRCHRNELEFAGHQGDVYSIALDQTGNTVATGGRDGAVKLWDAKTGKMIGELSSSKSKVPSKAHSAAVFGLTFSPDDRLLISASRDKSIKIWNVSRRTMTGSLDQHKGFVFDVAVRKIRDNSKEFLLASASADRTVRLVKIDYASGRSKPVATLSEGQPDEAKSGHFDRVHAVDISPDGQWVVSGGLDRQVIIWHPLAGSIKRFQLHKAEVLDVAISPDGKLVASASGDTSVRVWRVNVDAGEIASLPHRDRVFSVEFSPDSKKLMTAGMGRVVKLWTVADLGLPSKKPQITRNRNRRKDFFFERQPPDRLQFALAGHSGTVFAARFSGDGNRIGTAGGDGLAKTWPVSASHHQTLVGHSRVINSLAFADKGMWLLSGSSDGTARIWDLASGLSLGKPFAATKNSPRILAVAVSPGSEVIGWGGQRGHLLIQHRLPGSVPIELKDGKAAHGGDIASIAFSPNGKTLVSASHDSTVKFWDIHSRKVVKQLTRHSGRTQSIRFSPDGRWFATAGEAGECFLWSTQTHEVVESFNGHTGKVWAVAFSPDSKWFVSAGQDQTIRLWDLQSMKFVRSLKGHAQDVLCLAFSPDGRTLASGSRDKTVRLWDLETAETKTTLTGHSYNVWSVAFSHDGKTLASSGVELRLWRAGQ